MLTVGMRKVIRAIAGGKPHRAAHDTYQRLCDEKYAAYISGHGWILLPRGKVWADSHPGKA